MPAANHSWSNEIPLLWKCYHAFLTALLKRKYREAVRLLLFGKGVKFGPLIFRQRGQFSIAVDREAVREWKLPSRTGLNLEYIARMINPQVRGWINYYGKFFRSALYHLTGYIEYQLCLWARRKYKRLRERREKAREWLRRIRKRQLGRLFVHWNFVN